MKGEGTSETDAFAFNRHASPQPTNRQLEFELEKPQCFALPHDPVVNSL
jgi:hypothetical protein